MCGVAGMIGHDPGEIRAALLRAQRVQQHRGPDGDGLTVQPAGNWSVGLGHQRLAIIDRSPGGAQPMASADGRHWLAYNGEVYNYREIRAELARLGHVFAGASDTEVILHALAQWGEDATRRFNGMWGLAWLDLGRRRLVLSRDRLGVKPLYLHQAAGGLCFASEIKAILEMAGTRFPLNPGVVGQYVLQSLLDTSEETFFAGIRKVPAGSNVVIDLATDTLRPTSAAFWQPAPPPPVAGMDEAADQVRELLTDAVRLRLRSDVPVGVLLSGGLDSSSIAACMQAILGRDADLNLLSAVSDGGRFDEAPFIDQMAAHLGRPVHKVRLDIDPARALDLLSDVCWHNDEPVGGFSNVAHFLLMKQARDLGVTVILSGQGADETFCGYRKFLGFHLQALVRAGHGWQALGVAAAFWRQGTVFSQFSWDEAKRYLPGLGSRGPDTVAGPAVLGAPRPADIGLAPGQGLVERQLADLQRFSVPILTHYEDRMSMAWSREVRTPFLDYRLVERALFLPAALKLGDGWTKYALRRAMAPLLPPAIAWRKDKQNFVNPQSEWLKHELRPALAGIFGGDSLIYRHGLFARPGLTRLYDRYCRQPEGRGLISFKEVFQPLALELWLRRYGAYLAT